MRYAQFSTSVASKYIDILAFEVNHVLEDDVHEPEYGNHVRLHVDLWRGHFRVAPHGLQLAGNAEVLEVFIMGFVTVVCV